MAFSSSSPGDTERLAALLPRIDPARETERIGAFLRTQVFERFRRKGLVIGLSGGVDSALVAALAVTALGAGRVFGLALPERESDPESERLARNQAEALGIRFERIDLTPILETLGVYRRKEAIIAGICPDFDPARDRTKMGLSGSLLDEGGYGVYYLTVQRFSGEVRRSRLDPPAFLGLMAAQNMKQRSRMIQLYRHAEETHYLVGGTTNRTEYLQGLIVKHGDGGVDIEPVVHLYKTQVFALATHLGVLPEILTRAPSPDTWSAGVDDEEFHYRLPVRLLDAFLHLRACGTPAPTMTWLLGLDDGQVHRVLRDLDSKSNTTWHLRAGPPNLLDDGGGA